MSLTSISSCFCFLSITPPSLEALDVLLVMVDQVLVIIVYSNNVHFLGFFDSADKKGSEADDENISAFVEFQTIVEMLFIHRPFRSCMGNGKTLLPP